MPPERPAAALTPQAFAAACGCDATQLAQLERYAALLQTWTKRINLVSEQSLEDLWRRHFLDSAQLMAYLPPPPSGRRRVLVDLGSGAGFPGLVLALLGAGEVHLIEADQRKAAFLREAIRLTAAPAVVHNARIEALKPFQADVVTARALAALPALLAYAARFRGPETEGPLRLLLLKGKRAEEELTAARKAWKMTVESFPSRSDSTGVVLSIGLNDRGSTRY